MPSEMTLKFVVPELTSELHVGGVLLSDWIYNASLNDLQIAQMLIGSSYVHRYCEEDPCTVKELGCLSSQSPRHVWFAIYKESHYISLKIGHSQTAC